ncbi:MAG TPA: serine hydrolase [Sphingomicrobium sp.]
MISRIAIAAAMIGAAYPADAAPVTSEQLAGTTALVTRTVDELVTVPGGIAGYSVVIAGEGQPDFILTRGVANAVTGAPVTPDTAFYIASQTKSYTGLLAAKLDRTGKFPLNTSLADVWPDLRLPEPVDPKQVTFRHLLSHSAGFDNPVLGERTAYTDEVAAKDYPRLLAAGSTVNGKTFEYTNAGYLIYAAALKERTGRDWKQWLASDIFDPLDLSQSFTRSSQIPADRIAWGHQWDGSKWIPAKPKDDAIMHAAGGMFASSRDLAKWIRWQLAEGRGQSAIAPADFRATHTDLVGGGLGEGGFGISCNGYSLGWSICTFAGEQLLYHGGTYTGARSHLFLLPKQKVGVAISANSDGMTGTLGQFFMSVIAASLLGQPEAAERAAQMVAGYRERVAKQVENRARERAGSEADPRWSGWAWRPDRAALAAYEGTYRNPLYGDLRVKRAGEGLNARLGVMDRMLRPAQPGLFGMQPTPVEMWEPVQFTSDRGKVVSVTFNGRQFTRQ